MNMSMNRQFLIAIIDVLCNNGIFTEDKTAFKQKITVIKSLAMPFLIQSLTVLPNLSDKIINEYRTFSIHSYGVENQTKLKGIIGQYEEGLKMPHIESFCHRLNMVWINKILDPLKIAPWKTLFIDQYNKYGADKIWMLEPN